MARKPRKPSRIGLFEPIEALGQGSMGELWLCYDQSLDRNLVIKRISPQLRGHRETEQRFAREAQALAALEHPGIVSIYGFWIQDETLNLSMEYVKGYNLRQILDLCPRPPLWFLLFFLREILDALDHAHQERVVHRDLKPSNLMLDRHGRVRIVDFGIARMGDQDLTQPGTRIGTTAYMSPEQVHGLEAGPASDLFSLGIIAWEMITGTHPFRQEEGTDTMQAILQQKPQGDFPSAYPRFLNTWTLSLLHKDIRKRPSSAGQARQQLDLIMQGLPRNLNTPALKWFKAIRKQIPPPPPPRWQKKRLLPWLLLAAGFGGCLGILGVQLW